MLSNFLFGWLIEYEQLESLDAKTSLVDWPTAGQLLIADGMILVRQICS